MEVREILRRWKRGAGFRAVAAAVGADRKTVRRYVEAAQRHGLTRDGVDEVADDLVGAVVADVVPGAPIVVGAMRDHCRAHRELIKGWVEEGCKSPKVVRLLHRHTGVSVPARTLRRFLAEEVRDGKAAGATVRIVDPPPGQVLEIDFMKLGTMKLEGEQVDVLALIAVAASSRHAFVWPCLGMTVSDLIDGLEAAWAFYGGVFPVIVADNPKAIVTRADPLAPTFNEDIAEYAQARGFVFDQARVRRPQDKPKVERTVSYARSDGFLGERFLDLEDVRTRMATWCREVAGKRSHGTTRREPLEAFLTEELPLLLPAPNEPYDAPQWVQLKVGRDHAVCAAEALYSVPYALRDAQLKVRIDRATVKMYHRGRLVKVHVRVPRGGCQIDGADLPPGTAELATRDAQSLQEKAEGAGSAVGEYVRRVLEGPAPWTRMRHVYRLLGLCKRFGNPRVDAACQKALDLDVVDVLRIDRMLQRDLDGLSVPTPPPNNVIRPRFGRDPGEFKTSSGGDPHDA